MVAARGLSCSLVHGILFPQPGIEPASPALQGRFLTTHSQELHSASSQSARSGTPGRRGGCPACGWAVMGLWPCGEKHPDPESRNTGCGSSSASCGWATHTHTQLICKSQQLMPALLPQEVPSVHSQCPVSLRFTVRLLRSATFKEAFHGLPC